MIIDLYISGEGEYGTTSRPLKHGIGFFLAFVVSGILLALTWHCLTHPYFFAYLSLAAFYWISVLVTGSANPLHIAMGADGRLSTSKSD